MRKLIILILFLILIFTQKNYVSAQMMGDSVAGENNILNESSHGESLDKVLEELLSTYKVNTVQELNCDEISDVDFEKVGEAWMSSIHPDLEVHARMDEMMGGEGSESLRGAHIGMGENYLGCAGDSNFGGMMGGFGMMPMMWMMGSAGSPQEGGGVKNMFWGNQMMGGNYLSGGALGLFWLVNSILVTVLLIALIRYFWIKGGDKK